MKTSISQYIFFSLIIIFLSACCKDNNPYIEGCQTEPFEELGPFNLDTMKPYVFFETGSYWIYKCDLTGELDSQYCVSSDAIVRKAIGVKRVYDFENIYSNNRSLKYKTNILMQGQTSDPDIINFDFGIVWQRNIKGTIAPVLSTWQDKEKGFGNGVSDTYFRGKLPTFVVEGKEYHDVLVYEVLRDPTFPKPDDQTGLSIGSSGNSIYYWAKNVGLIKIQHNTGNYGVNPPVAITLLWNLIDYKTNY
ncbi:MAG: hypothetical protein Q8K70_09115 [Bacteroidota bacterium]|nr:hypothetical protein [Bacteroidota bacterium]